MFSWTRNFYAKFNGVYFCFESKRTRDNFVNNGATFVSAKEAYEHYSNIIKIEDRKVPIGDKHYDRG